MSKSDPKTKVSRFFLVIANADGDIVHFNNVESLIRNASPVTESMLGYDLGNLSGHHVMDIIHPADRRVVFNAMASTVEGSARPVRKVRLVKRDGSLIDAQMSTFFLMWTDKVVSAQFCATLQ